MEPSLFGDDCAPNAVVTTWLKFELIYELWTGPLLFLKLLATCQIPMTRWMVRLRDHDPVLHTILHTTVNAPQAPGLATNIH
jgi:hypothetical protein